VYIKKGDFIMAFFNFNLDEEYIWAQKEVLNRKFRKHGHEDSLEKERKIRTYFMYAVAAWKGTIEDHPAKEELQQYISYLKNKGYKFKRTEDAIHMLSSRNTVISKEILQDEDALPECVGLMELITARAKYEEAQSEW
jgi:hypothetical protein